MLFWMQMVMPVLLTLVYLKKHPFLILFVEVLLI